MTINRPIEKKKQTTPKEMIKKNIFKEIKKQKTPKEIKTNKKPNKKRKQKTPKEIKLSPKIIEQRGGTNPPPEPMEVKPVGKPVEVVVAKPVKNTNNSRHVPMAEAHPVSDPNLVKAEQTQNPLLTAEARYANNNIPVADENLGVSQPNEKLVEATEVNISSAKPTNSQPNATPQQKSSIMTESEFMKKYEITETQIKQVKLLLSNAFAA